MVFKPGSMSMKLDPVWTLNRSCLSPLKTFSIPSAPHIVLDNRTLHPLRQSPLFLLCQGGSQSTGALAGGEEDGDQQLGNPQGSSSSELTSEHLTGQEPSSDAQQS